MPALQACNNYYWHVPVVYTANAHRLIGIAQTDIVARGCDLSINRYKEAGCVCWCRIQSQGFSRGSNVPNQPVGLSQMALTL